MPKPVKPIPDGYHTLTPYLYINGAAAAIEFYQKAFGAEELFRMDGPSPGMVGHAEIRIGDSIVMMADECQDWGIRSPTTLGGNGSSLVIYVEDVDAVFNRAVDAGATIARPLQNQFYGDRSGSITDPFGHQWTIATHVEDVPADELERRAAQEMAKMATSS